MGLMMDANGIPVAYDLFPGNESEKVHMRPIIERIKREYDDCRIIFVADRGLNTSDNIYWLNGDNKADANERDGYVYGQTIRGADAEFKTWVLSDGYKTDVIDDDGESITFKHKSRIYPKELHVNVTKPGSKKPAKKSVIVDQKQMVYYSEKYAKKQRADREAMIARANDLIKYPKKYDRVTAKGSAAYVKNIAFDKTTVKPGTFFLEKLCSGAYLGPVSWFALQAAAKEGLFSDKVNEAILKLEGLTLIEMDKFLHHPYDKECLLGKLLCDCGSDDDADKIFQILDAIAERSARYSAAILTACAIQTGEGKNAAKPICILCDGTTFFKTYKVRERVYGYLDEVLTRQLGIYWNIVACDNDITLGAAISGLID
jgi:hypothetical protein